MSSTAQKQALVRYRGGLQARGLVRFEVLGLDSDKAWLRALSRQLAPGGPEEARLRAALRAAMRPGGERRGGILSALRSSPLVGSGIEFRRPKTSGRKVDI